MKRILALGICAVFLACGNSTDSNSILSAQGTDTLNRSGSAYNIYDTVPSLTPDVPVVASAAPVPAQPAAADAASAGTETAAAATAAAPAKAAAPDDSADIKKGEALISKSDCLACHKIADKLLGPSYKEVANKYPNTPATIAQLADKIKKGGSGVWGPIPMSPHPTLSDDDAKAMVKYVLSLK